MVKLEIANGYFYDYLENPPQRHNSDLFKRLGAISIAFTGQFKLDSTIASSTLPYYPSIREAMGFPSVTQARNFFIDARNLRLIPSAKAGPSLCIAQWGLGLAAAVAFSQDIPKPIPPDLIKQNPAAYREKLLAQTRENLGPSQFTGLLENPATDQNNPQRVRRTRIDTRLNRETVDPYAFLKVNDYTPENLCGIIQKIGATHSVGETLSRTVNTPEGIVEIIPGDLNSLLEFIYERLRSSKDNRQIEPSYLSTDVGIAILKGLARTLSGFPQITLSDLALRLLTKPELLHALFKYTGAEKFK